VYTITSESNVYSLALCINMARRYKAKARLNKTLGIKASALRAKATKMASRPRLWRNVIVYSGNFDKISIPKQCQN